MANPLYDSFGKNNIFNNELSGFINQVKEMQKSFKGDPKEEVQKLLNSGQISQQQFNQYSQMANQIMSFMGTK